MLRWPISGSGTQFVCRNHMLGVGTAKQTDGAEPFPRLTKNTSACCTEKRQGGSVCQETWKSGKTKEFLAILAWPGQGILWTQ